MQLDLRELASVATELGFDCELLGAELAVTLAPGSILSFQNVTDGDDNAIGFKGAAWHTHDTLYVTLGGDGHVEYAADEILIALASGDLLVVEETTKGKVRDRWLASPRNVDAFSSMEAGDEVRVVCVAR